MNPPFPSLPFKVKFSTGRKESIFVVEEIKLFPVTTYENLPLMDCILTEAEVEAERKKVIKYGIANEWYFKIKGLGYFSAYNFEEYFEEDSNG